jgi:hypothetical protein
MHSTVTGSASRRFLLALVWLLVGFALSAGQAFALTISPTAVVLPVGAKATVKVSNSRGAVRVSSSAPAIASVSYASGIATITGVAAGSATVTIRDKVSQLTVAVTVNPPLAVSPTSVTVTAGADAAVKVTNPSGPVTVQTSNPAVATVGYGSGTATIHGVAAGSATITIADSYASRTVAVTVTAPPALTVSPTSVTVAVGASATLSVSNANGAVTATSSNPGFATVTYTAATATSGTATIRGVAVGSATITIRDSVTTRSVATTVTAAVAGNFTLIAWNNLGMHCVDGVDDSIFSILPPFNIVNAQLVDRGTGQRVTSGVALSYTATTDTHGSFNSISSTKTNFWQYAGAIYGLSPAPDVGLTGTRMASLTPAPMTFDGGFGYFQAQGIPITPYDDSGKVNYYPMVQVTATNTSGQVLATTKIVLPVSDEINCLACHKSTTSTNAAANAARPAAGWVFDPNPVTDWKKNILRLHDQLQAGNPVYTAALAGIGRSQGLYSATLAGKPVLCASCHVSNALLEVGYPNGIAGIPPLTQSLHASHAGNVDPATGMTLDQEGNRSACYQCHPGSTTQCMRGAMSPLLDATGNPAINCQSCHGNMSKVGAAGRVGWFQTPNCQACHHDGKRETSAVDANGNLRTWADQRFATNPNTPTAAAFPNLKPTNAPAGGFSMFRFSTGHGAMQCEACHGATHAEYPSTEANDNVQSIAEQGYKGTVRECTVCHASVPLTGTGGPHGMHTVGASWVSGHENMIASSGGTAACAYCHGADFRGSPLSALGTAKTLAGRTFAAGHQMSCYDCHNGPSGD